MKKGNSSKKSQKHKTNLIDMFHKDREFPPYLSNNDITLENIMDVFSNHSNNFILEHSNIAEAKAIEITNQEESKEKREKTKNIYFNIIKKKKRGKRRLKNVSNIHDKNSKYNIICKIKVYFTKALLEQANNLYKKIIGNNQKDTTQWLKLINPKEIKRLNAEWFFKTTKEYLSSNISRKYINQNKDYNKKQIEAIYKESNMKLLINFFEQKVNIIYREYINSKTAENDIFTGMRKFNTDLHNIKRKYNYDDNYIKEMKRISTTLENIFLVKKNKINKKHKIV